MVSRRRHPHPHPRIGIQQCGFATEWISGELKIFGASTSTVGARGGVFDIVQGMKMRFGGYGVPMADKEAMLRKFALAIS